MKSLHPQKRVFSLYLDDALAVIDVKGLQLIERALLTIPHKESEVARHLKKQYGIPWLSEAQVLEELKTPHSLLRKYLEAMMVSILVRSQLLLHARFQAEIQALLRVRQETELFLEWESLRRGKRQGEVPQLKEYLLALSSLVAKCTQPIPETAFLALKRYALEAHRTDLLQFYLQYADRKLASLVVEMVDSHVTIMMYSFEEYERLMRDPNLTPEQRAELHDWLERQTSRMDALSPEKFTRTLPHVDLYDQVVLKQHLSKQLVNDTVQSMQLGKIVDQPLTQKEAGGEENKTEGAPAVATEYTGEPPDVSFSYVRLQQGLSHALEALFVEKDSIIVEEAPLVLC